MKSLKPNNPNSASATTDIVGPLRNLSGGTWESPAVELDRAICNSNTGELLASQVRSSPEQVNAAIAAAHKHHLDGTGRNVSSLRLSGCLEEIAASLQAVAEDIAAVDAVTTGVPIKMTRVLARVCSAAFSNAAKLARVPTVRKQESTFMVERLPLGAAAIIAPWNAPAGIACHKLASALAARCPIVFKPSEWAPHSAQIIASVIAELDVPPGVFNLVHGDGETGAAIVADERIAAVSLTGGLGSGRAVAAACAEQVKPAQLELGGNNAMIVLKGAPIDETADGVVTALTTLNGQWCRALGRLLVHKSVAKDLLGAVNDRLADLHIGESTDESIDMGPMVHESHLRHVEAAIEGYVAQGGEVHAPSKIPDLPGWFVAPMLVTGVAPENALDEVFGPVATVHEFDYADEAVSIANQAPYGLAGYVFGERDAAIDIARRLETGMVKVNAVTLFSPHPDLPRAAWKLSGSGEEGTLETFEFFRGTRVIGFPEAAEA